MSASLVGSEMCIRDRPSSAGRIPALLGRLWGYRGVRVGEASHPGPPNTCLLYTSDAADDM
eukprot:5066050-Alexandrium_andersonii.AAC.1